MAETEKARERLQKWTTWQVGTPRADRVAKGDAHADFKLEAEKHFYRKGKKKVGKRCRQDRLEETLTSGTLLQKHGGI